MLTQTCQHHLNSCRESDEGFWGFFSSILPGRTCFQVSNHPFARSLAILPTATTPATRLWFGAGGGLLSALGSVAKCQTWPAGLRASGPISRPSPRVDGEASILAPKPPLAPLRLSSCPQQPALLAPTEPTRAPAPHPGSDPASLRPERQRPTDRCFSLLLALKPDPSQRPVPCHSLPGLVFDCDPSLLSSHLFGRPCVGSGLSAPRALPATDAMDSRTPHPSWNPSLPRPT